MAALVETMAYSGQVPWHGKGTFSEELMDAKTALVKAQLDWTVSLGPVFAGRSSDDAYLMDDQRCVYRESQLDEGGFKVLSIVGKEYQTIQNIEVFDFMDSLVQDGIMRYETAMSLKGGALVVLLARLNDDMRIADDVFHRYICGSNSHDGNSAARFYGTDVRVVCMNTYRQSLALANRITKISHSGKIADKFDLARQMLSVNTEQDRRLKDFLEAAALKQVKDAQVDKLLSSVFNVTFTKGSLDEATTNERKAAVATFKDIYSQEVERQGPNAYSLVNAVTGYADHKAPVSKKATKLGGDAIDEARMVRFMGPAQAWKNEAITKLSALVDIKVPIALG